MRILTIIPTREELEFFLQACREQGHHAETDSTGRLPIARFPLLDVAVVRGGLGKAQFAVQTQYLIDRAHWELVVCAGAAGALLDGLAVGDVVIATETVEHDIRNRFGKPILPRFAGSDPVLARCRQGLRTEPAFRVHYSPIASGDEDVVDRERGAEIRALTGAVAVAWEGAGAARACKFSGVPYLEIRGLTDGANHTAALDYDLNLKMAMGNVARVVAFLSS